jgi:hypothetical protein
VQESENRIHDHEQAYCRDFQNAIFFLSRIVKSGAPEIGVIQLAILNHPGATTFLDDMFPFRPSSVTGYPTLQLRNVL